MTDISVVIPTFNRAHSTGRSIDSVLSQSRLVKEVIVVDDASSDDTVATLRAAYADDARVKVVALTGNRGGGFARNAGIDAATGDLLAFLDSDDAWLAGKLDRQIAATAGRSGFLCFTNLEVDHHDGKPAAAWNSQEWDEDSGARHYLFDLDQAIQTSTWLMPTKIARRVRFDPALRRHQDFDFVLRAEKLGVAFVYVPEVLVRYSADPDAARTSKRRNAEPSLRWMETARAYLSNEEIAAFYLKHVADMELADTPLRAIRRCAGSALRGHAPLGQTLRVIARNLAPEGLKSGLRALRGTGKPA